MTSTFEQRARAAGYSDKEIEDYKSKKPEKLAPKKEISTSKFIGNVAKESGNKGMRIGAQAAIGGAQAAFLPYEVASQAANLYMRSPGVAAQYLKQTAAEDIENMMDQKARGEWTPQDQERFNEMRKIFTMGGSELEDYAKQFVTPETTDFSIGGITNRLGYSPEGTAEKAARFTGLITNPTSLAKGAQQAGKEFLSQLPAGLGAAGLTEAGVPEMISLPVASGVQSLAQAASQLPGAFKSGMNRPREFGMKNLPITAEEPVMGQKTLETYAAPTPGIKESAKEFPKDIARATRGEIEAVFPQFATKTPEEISREAGSLFNPMREAASNSKVKFQTKETGRVLPPDTLDAHSIGKSVDNQIKALEKSEATLDDKGKSLLSYLRGIKEDFNSNPTKSLDWFTTTLENLNSKIYFDNVLKNDAKLINLKKDISNVIKENSREYPDVYKKFVEANQSYAKAMDLKNAAEILDPVMGERLDMAQLDKILYNPQKAASLKKSLGGERFNNIKKINSLARRGAAIYENIGVDVPMSKEAIELAVAVASGHTGLISKLIGIAGGRVVAAKILTDPRAQTAYIKFLQSMSRGKTEEIEKMGKLFLQSLESKNQE